MINVIGLGYIGLPTALMLAKNNQRVVGTDINQELVGKLRAGAVTFQEEGLDELMKQALAKNITFTHQYEQTNLYIITVPTPYVKETKKINPKYVINAVEKVLETCLDQTTIIIESTVSPGTIDKFIRPLINQSCKQIELVHAPERIIPGNMINELENNNRVIGADSQHTAVKVKELYHSFCKADIVITDIKTAEMSKVIENSYRDVNIAFANEIAKISKAAEIDVHEIIRVANMHPRVNILNPGPGVGGHCISVDPWFLVGDYPELTKVILSARETNDSRPDDVIARINEIMKLHNIRDKNKVGIYGMTYKENVDDTRESPTLQLVEKMQNYLSESLTIYDPMVTSKLVENQELNFDKFIDEKEFIIVMVAHDHMLKNIKRLTNKVVLDTQNILAEAYKL